MIPITYFGSLLLVTLIGFISPFRYLKPPFIYIGLIPIALGIVLNLWADALLKKRATTVKPNKKPTSFENGGPFAISRHPMYLGMVLILFGTAVITGCLMISITSLIFAFIMEKKFIPLEEKNMEIVFGKKYLDYKKRVRKWI